MRVLIIEDEARLARNVARILRTQAAYAVDVCANGTDGLHMALSNPYDLIVLDLMLPDIDGLDILRRLRAEGLDTPVLALTARISTEEIVDGLNSGCDDYLTKPFKIAELVARCRALIRRSYDHTAPVLTAGEFQINTATRRIACRGEEHQLRGMEYRLLEYLVLRAGEVVSKEQIIEHLYDFNAERFSNVVEVYVSALRRRFGTSCIRTVRGQGYVLTGEAQ